MGSEPAVIVYGDASTMQWAEQFRFAVSVPLLSAAAATSAVATYKLPNNVHCYDASVCESPLEHALQSREFAQLLRTLTGAGVVYRNESRTLHVGSISEHATQRAALLINFALTRSRLLYRLEPPPLLNAEQWTQNLRHLPGQLASLGCLAAVERIGNAGAEVHLVAATAAARGKAACCVTDAVDYSTLVLLQEKLRQCPEKEEEINLIKNRYRPRRLHPYGVMISDAVV